MLQIRKMKKDDLAQLYEIAKQAFQPDFERYGVYPPMMHTGKKKLRPPRIFGKTILADGTIIGGAYVAGFSKSGEIGAIFLHPDAQGKGYGRQIMLEIEKQHPRVKKWHLETPGESHGLHRFYESLGYQKARVYKDEKSGMSAVTYEKQM